jgi:hypothetical protein
MAREHDINSNGVRIWTVVQGNGVPLLLCNGGPGNGRASARPTKGPANVPAEGGKIPLQLQGGLAHVSIEHTTV